LFSFILFQIFIPPGDVLAPGFLELTIEFFQLQKELILFVPFLQFNGLSPFDIPEHLVDSVLITHLF
jgi:hypothetical protein